MIHPVTLELEPGQLLMANSGCLIIQVRAYKYVGRNHFVLVNAGFNDLIRPAMYGSYYHASFTPSGHQAIIGEALSTVLSGALCESGDVFTQTKDGLLEYPLLPPANIEDLIVFHDCGAYGASMSSNYNNRPLAAEVLIDGDGVRLIR
jgi:diaminopimelate decarboxylase